jgi:PhzF family phenazine biosynthesis protein
MRRRFSQIDVFTTEPFAGNPVAVVHDADGLTDEEMHRFANWTNLSETTFLLSPTDPTADYRVRIFTTTVELPFAGHPTLGTCHAWLAAGGVPRRDGVIVQQCAGGLIEVRSEGGCLAFGAPPLVRSGPIGAELSAEVTRVLGIEPSEIVDMAWADNGPGWIAVLVRDAATVLAVRPSPTPLKLGVVGMYPPGRSEQIEVRAFFPRDGVLDEDPVTGSLNASVAMWLLGSGRITAPYVAAQGTVLGRTGRVQVSTDDAGTIWIGGGTVTCIDGDVLIG